MAFRYEFINDSRLTDVQFLFKKVFKKNVTIEYLKAKYDTSYVDHKHLATIAYDGNRPIALYGVIPQLFKVGGKDVLVGHTCDSITVPEHQRKGIHADLANKCYDELIKRDFKFVYAFHSENTYHSTKKLGWNEQKRMTATFLPCNRLPLAQVRDVLGGGNRNFELLSRELKDHIIGFGSHQEVDSGVMDGRVYSQATFDYHSFTNNLWMEIEDCSFWIKVDRIVHIGYACVPDLTRFKTAIRILRKACTKAGFNRILIQTHPNSQMGKMVPEIADGVGSWLVGYKAFDDLDLEPVLFEYADLDTF